MDNETAYLESLFNNRAAVTDFQAYFDRWEEKSAATMHALRARLEKDLPYGDDIMETMDVFLPQGQSKALLMFIHGGYWRSLDKKQHAFIAAPFVDAGVAVASINYSLCPAVSMEHIVRQMIAASAYLYRNAADFGVSRGKMYVAGHSAGGHLAAMALACLWPQAVRGLPRKLFQGAFSISGVYDLRVLTRVPSINADLKMTLESATRLSPALMQPPTNVPLSIAVGGREIGGFKDQHRIIAQAWPDRIGADLPCPEENHFSMLDRFADQRSDLFGASMRMMGL
jgi:arylformamidase